MIVKILSRHSPSYALLIDYILKGSKTNGEEPQIFTHNIKSENRLDWEKEFEENETFRLYERKDSIFAYHEIISFISKENNAEISKEMLEDISRKYIALRGNDGLIIGSVHRDTDAVHIHFMSSGLAFRTGKAFRLSRSELLTLKSDLQKYHIQKYPSLTHSICEHGTNKPYYSQAEWQAQQRGQRNTIKTDISLTVQSCFNSATSQQNFLDLLRDAGLHHYERKGKVQGIFSPDGMKFRFSGLGIDMDKFNKTNTPMKIKEITKNEAMTLETSLVSKNEEFQLALENEYLTDKTELENTKKEEKIFDENEMLSKIDVFNNQVRYNPETGYIEAVESSKEIDEISEKEEALEAQLDDKLLGSDAQLQVEMELDNLATNEDFDEFDLEDYDESEILDELQDLRDAQDNDRDIDDDLDLDDDDIDRE